MVTSLVGRKAYLDWGDHVVAITIYKKGYQPPGLAFTRSERGHGLPRLVDVCEVLGEVVETNPQDSVLKRWGLTFDDYVTCGVMQGDNDDIDAINAAENQEDA